MWDSRLFSLCQSELSSGNATAEGRRALAPPPPCPRRQASWRASQDQDCQSFCLSQSLSSNILNTLKGQPTAPTPPHPQRWGKANGLAANTTVRLNGRIDTVVGTTQYSKWTQGGSRFPNAPEMSRANTEEPWAESKPASATAAWLLRQ